MCWRLLSVKLPVCIPHPAEGRFVFTGQPVVKVDQSVVTFHILIQGSFEIPEKHEQVFVNAEISLPAQITLLVSNYCTWGLHINYFHTRVNLFTLSLQEGAFRTFSKNCSLTFTASLVTPKHSKDRHSHAFSIHSNHDYLGQWWIHHFITWLLPDCGNIRQSLK